MQLPNIPNNYLIKLNNVSAISLVGEEQVKYLQGQVTCDVNALSAHNLLHGAHCNAKGKVLSCFRLIEKDQQLLLIQPKATIPASLAELKKFGVFAKVDITTSEQFSFYGLVAENAKEILSKHFSQIPDNITPVVNEGTTSLIYIAGDITRYLLIDRSENLAPLLTSLALPILNDSLWVFHEICQGFPFLSSEHLDQYVPQMLNIQAIHGISFTKGCYLGQETVARMQYLGKNKRAMFSLQGQTSSPISVNDIVEMQLGENWRKAGDVIASYQDSELAFVQIVLANDVNPQTKFRVKGQEGSSLTLMPLPYSLNPE
ncbi:tRNA-modifying protein YgfZ [Thalassotalea profundi]|uniref:tRNA-modifying protein YgfZ n=1 Tax=Thalassotalea profundi TaxID=2036687 RepID=A0ABQ3IQ05_9GAMM|nr:tRNA-modifying protein YgfZ [Thalassotalea profundi]GHE86143.1 tRNA-modifying protein YgfZ [Thalassotalea profundi]